MALSICDLQTYHGSWFEGHKELIRIIGNDLFLIKYESGSNETAVPMICQASDGAMFVVKG